MPIAHEIVRQQSSRRRDRWGSGQFGALRGGGRRIHRGVDIAVTQGESVYSPIRGILYREAVPYRDDRSYRGVVLRGSDEWNGYEVKVFYVQGIFSGRVDPGQPIGTAQDLTRRYPGITNHIHIELRHNARLLSPNEMWAMSF